MINEFLNRTQQITLQDLKTNNSIELLVNHAVEELGEFAAANTVESGYKKKELKESAKVEAVDLVICALSLFFAKGGTIEELATIGHEKLNKWEQRL